ncbi:hypothetical protein EJ04DRAFT_582560 [Polyplosphaeria fusca]|uniref:Uncharacterized protein n=1 Tax=Polyplosphaeria fusca TaxID=682080 RepID=A0A9P4QI00_9PLEO|nr:hypothetical protein EJ04DRAFT_582560 [Polyplosphaeria fusca]
MGLQWATHNVAPELEHIDAISESFGSYAPSLLSEETSIQRIRCNYDGSDCHLNELDESQLSNDLSLHSGVDAPKDTWEFFFINKFLIRDRKIAAPTNSNRLQISTSSYQQLVSYCDLPPSFVHALFRHYLPTGRGFREISSINDAITYDHWYFLPVRVQVLCKKSSGHTVKTPDNNQMNPFNYLHLPDVKVDKKGSCVDIRGSCIAIYSKHNTSTGRSTFVIFNLLDGRWDKVVEEPRIRITETIAHANENGQLKSPYFHHLVYLTSTLKWWTNAMNSVNVQLIAYEDSLQHEMDNNEDSTKFYTDLNRALHSIAAHLHRYGSELKSLEATISDMDKQLTEVCNFHERTDDANRQIIHGLNHIASQVREINDFVLELEKKLNNILALLFNRMQIANTQAMNKVLQAIQADTKTSQILSKEMQKDSLSMKTIAVVTMFFLPGATFAALFSMPFFGNNDWLSSVSRMWLWFAFTVPTTSLTLLFYWYYKRRGEQIRSEEDGKVDEEDSTNVEKL